MSLYPKCTNCYKELSDLDKEENIKHNNTFSPICMDCINEVIELLNAYK